MLPSDHLNCWWLFVQACILICQPLISNADIDRADQLLLEFCKRFETIYGPESCTINLHLHCHLAECLRDYGPAHAAWSFSFERCNGLLGRMPSNKRSLQIEKIMMIWFIEQMETPQSLPQLSELNQFFPMMTVGSLRDTGTNSELFIKHSHLSRRINLHELNFGCVDDLIYPVGQMYEDALQQYHVDFLTKMYQAVVTDGTVFHVSPLC